MERAGPALFLGLGAVAATAKAGQYASRAYQEYQASLPTEEELKKQQEADAAAADKEGSKASSKDQKGQDAKQETKKTEGKRENIFAKFFDLGVGSKYYEGGFESEMTRREAALVLGVRESSSPKRIKEAHRNLLMLNHPDTGGSTYIAGKINEAKELLIKGRKGL
jgi:DnaJ-class molecular chaperone